MNTIVSTEITNSDYLNRLYSNVLEYNYSQKTNINYRRSLGQFFTPFKIAEFMSEWLLFSDKKDLNILDPSAGFGIFERALVKKNQNLRYTFNFDLWEIDQNISFQLSKIVSSLKVKNRIYTSDFLINSWESLYDGIIANPPYYKHHYIKNKTNIHQSICLKTSFPFSIQTNIYCWFLIKCMNLLKLGGRLAFIVPSEFFNSNYGIKIKEYLKQSGIIIHLISINFKENVFDNAITTSVIILAKKMVKKSRNISFYSVNDIQELKDLGKFLTDYPKDTFDTVFLNPNIKWRNYFNGSHQTELDNKLISLSEYGRFSRGIATGANNYFTLSEKEVEQYSIPKECLKNCITKATYAKGISFSDISFKELKDLNKKVYLFDGESSNNEHCIHYLRLGEKVGINNRFLTKNRNPWYSLEKRKVSKIWAAVFGRKGLKFVWNDTDCLNLTCFHSFNPTEKGEKYLSILFLYLNTNMSKEFFDREKREFGNGLEKFEPNDINKSLVIDFDNLSDKDLKKLISLQKEFIISKESVRVVIIKEAEIIFRSSVQLN